jgi:hypothetical protein
MRLIVFGDRRRDFFLLRAIDLETERSR